MGLSGLGLGEGGGETQAPDVRVTQASLQRAVLEVLHSMNVTAEKSVIDTVTGSNGTDVLKRFIMIFNIKKSFF